MVLNYLYPPTALVVRNYFPEGLNYASWLRVRWVPETPIRPNRVLLLWIAYLIQTCMKVESYVCENTLHFVSELSRLKFVKHLQICARTSLKNEYISFWLIHPIYHQDSYR